MKKLSKIDESVWSDIHKRSNGRKERKEDDINILDIKDLCYYLKTIYKSSNSSMNDNIYIQDYYLTICLYQDEDGYFRFLYYDGSSIETQYDVLETINCISEIKQKYTINTYTNDFDVKIATIYPKDQARVPVTNRFFIEIIDFFLDRINVPLEQQIEKITESIWSDIHKRSNGEQIRKEDEFSNLKYLKPLDMGGSVLWADNDLALKDGFCYFSFDEAFELVKNSGWRIPTLEEVAELDVLYNRGSYSSDSEAFYFKHNSNVLVFEKKGFIYLTASDSPIDFDFYYCWTSSLYDNGSAHILTFDNDHPIHSPLNNKSIVDQIIHAIERGKLCVRLVKDK